MVGQVKVATFIPTQINFFPFPHPPWTNKSVSSSVKPAEALAKYKKEKSTFSPTLE